MPNILPTYVAGTWDHLTTIQNDLFMEAMVDPAKIAAPTFTIMHNSAREFNLNVDGTFILPIDLSVNPMIYAEGVNVIFDTRHNEETTRASYRPALAYTGNAVSILQTEGGGEFNDEATLIPELLTRTKACNKGLTGGMVYEIWSKQNYTTAGGVAAEPTGSTINIDSIMTSIYLTFQIMNKPATMINRFNSLPSIVKPHGAGHTYGGISSENLWWRPKVYYNGEAGTITEISSTSTIPYTTWCANAPSDNVDLVTTPISAGGVVWSMRNIDLWLNELQKGGGYELYIACPPTGYSAILNWVRDNAVAQNNQILTDMGITKNFTHSSYNATFYSDPTLEDIYPNSLWAYDPESTFFAAVRGFYPYLINWDRIPQTTTSAMAKIMRYQLVSVNPVSTGALHNIRWD